MPRLKNTAKASRSKDNESAQSSENHIDPKKITYRLSVPKFRTLLQKLNYDQRKVIKSCGFGSLLSLKCNQTPREVCAWIAARFDCDNKSVKLEDGSSFQITPFTVHQILGIPFGGCSIDKKASTRAKMLIEQGMGIEGGTAPTAEDLINLVDVNLTGDSLIRIFMLITLSTLLCPTSNPRPSPDYYEGIADVENIPTYDWCTFVLDWLVDRIRQFQETVRKAKEAGKVCSVSLGGCILIPMMAFFDYLQTDGVSVANCIPRLPAWDENTIKAYESLDYTRLKIKDVNNTPFYERQPTLSSPISLPTEVCIFIDTLIPSDIDAQVREKLKVICRGFYRNSVTSCIEAFQPIITKQMCDMIQVIWTELRPRPGGSTSEARVNGGSEDNGDDDANPATDGGANHNVSSENVDSAAQSKLPNDADGGFIEDSNGIGGGPASSTRTGGSHKHADYLDSNTLNPEEGIDIPNGMSGEKNVTEEESVPVDAQSPGEQDVGSASTIAGNEQSKQEIGMSGLIGDDGTPTEQLLQRDERCNSISGENLDQDGNDSIEHNWANIQNAVPNTLGATHSGKGSTRHAIVMDANIKSISVQVNEEGVDGNKINNLDSPVQNVSFEDVGQSRYGQKHTASAIVVYSHEEIGKSTANEKDKAATMSSSSLNKGTIPANDDDVQELETIDAIPISSWHPDLHRKKGQPPVYRGKGLRKRTVDEESVVPEQKKKKSSMSNMQASCRMKMSGLSQTYKQAEKDSSAPLSQKFRAKRLVMPSESVYSSTYTVEMPGQSLVVSKVEKEVYEIATRRIRNRAVSNRIVDIGRFFVDQRCFGDSMRPRHWVGNFVMNVYCEAMNYDQKKTTKTGPSKCFLTSDIVDKLKAKDLSWDDAQGLLSLGSDQE